MKSPLMRGRARHLAPALPLVVALLLLVPCAASAKETWVKVRSKNFTVISNDGEREARKMASQMELFRDVIAHLFPKVNLNSSVPTTVILFKSHESFRPFKPKYNGKTRENVGGYFLARSDINYIALTSDSSDSAEAHQIIFHEYEHFITSNNMYSAPPWLHEGLAEFYSTLTRRGDDARVRLGGPIARHILTLRAHNLIPLKTLFAVDSRSPHYNESSKAGIFYAQSWALVHYLMLGGGPTRQQQFNRFVSKLSSDMPVEENFRQSFQAEYEVIEKELRQYVSKFTFPVLEVTFKDLEADKEAQVATLSESEARYHLGDLLLRSRRYDDADEYLRKAVELDPKFAPAKVSLAILRIEQERFAEADKHLQDALALNPQDPLAHYYRAVVLRQGGQIEEAVKSYKQAITLKPDMGPAHADLAYTYLREGQLEEAVEAFKYAIRWRPNVSHFFRSRSYAYLQLGRGGLAAIDASIFIKREGWSDQYAPYMALTAHFGHRLVQRAAHASRILEEAMTKGETANWPYPVIRYLQKSIDAQQLLALATDNDKLTEAHAYIGMDLMLNGDRNAAMPHFVWVKENGNRRFVEYELALSQIKRLETSETKPAQ